MSNLINASRTSTTRGLWQMRAQERADMESHLELRHRSRTPITPIDETAHNQHMTTPPPTVNAHLPPPPRSMSAHANTTTTTTTRTMMMKNKMKPVNPFPSILPSDSFWSVSLPFDTDLHLYDDYVRFDGGIRFERILEDLDAFAGNTAHLHIKKGTERMFELNEAEGKTVTLPDISIVTASVDGQSHQQDRQQQEQEQTTGATTGTATGTATRTATGTATPGTTATTTTTR